MGQKAKWEYFRAIYERYRQAARNTTAARLALRLHFKWRDNPDYGFILEWLDAFSGRHRWSFANRLRRKQ